MNSPAQTQVLPAGASRIGPRSVLAAFLVLLAAAPLVLPDFYVTLLNYIGLSAMVALGLVLLTGVGGLTSFGQAALRGPRRLQPARGSPRRRSCPAGWLLPAPRRGCR